MKMVNGKDVVHSLNKSSKKLKEHGFFIFLLFCSIATLIFSSVLYCFWVLPNDAPDLKNLNNSITNITSSNVTELEKLIDWQGQGTISWGLGFLAAITVFFTILIALRGTEKKNGSKDTWIIDLFLGGLGVLFLIISVYAIFELLRYYRIVATLQNRWQDVTQIVVPKGWQFNPILHYWGEMAIIVLSLIATLYLLISYSLSYLKNRETYKSEKTIVTYEQLLKEFESLADQIKSLKDHVKDLDKAAEDIEKRLNVLTEKKNETQPQK
jgi:hypothetical protein